MKCFFSGVIQGRKYRPMALGRKKRKKAGSVKEKSKKGKIKGKWKVKGKIHKIGDNKTERLGYE
jgi:hypothetical protein